MVLHCRTQKVINRRAWSLSLKFRIIFCCSYLHKRNREDSNSLAKLSLGPVVVYASYDCHHFVLERRKWKIRYDWKLKTLFLLPGQKLSPENVIVFGKKCSDKAFSQLRKKKKCSRWNFWNIQKETRIIHCSTTSSQKSVHQDAVKHSVRSEQLSIWREKHFQGKLWNNFFFKGEGNSFCPQRGLSFSQDHLKARHLGKVQFRLLSSWVTWATQFRWST